LLDVVRHPSMPLTVPLGSKQSALDIKNEDTEIIIRS
jgi:hypothetical protein